jgi:hypothetical protein
MIPKELKRDECGLDRIDRIEYADHLIAEARAMVASGKHPRCADSHEYQDAIQAASLAYFDAGLGRLADRVEHLDVGTLDAWRKFDQANAATEI